MLNTDFQGTSIVYQECKILSISDEYWMSIGSFDIDKVEIYWRNGVSYNYDKDYFPYRDYLSWKIQKQESSFKVSVMKLKDALGYEQEILISVQDESSIEDMLSELIDLSNYGSFLVYKLIRLLQQINSYKSLNQEEKRKAQEFFLSVIEPIYKKCKVIHPNAFHDIENLEEFYDTIRSSFFD